MSKRWSTTRVSLGTLLALHLTAALIVCSPFALGAAGLAGLVGLVVADLNLTTDVEATVWARRWKRTIEVARWDEVERVADCEDVPVGATILERGLHVSAEGRLHHHHHHSSHSSHVEIQCRYRMLDWVPEEPVKRVGEPWEARAWPDAPSADACPEPVERGCVRETGRKEEALLTLVPPGEAAITCAVPEATWEEVALGEEVLLPRSLVLQRPLCAEVEPLSPAQGIAP